MDAARCVIGVDIGTSSTKAVLYDGAGAVLARHGVEYPLLTPAPGAAELDPDQVVGAVIESIAGVVRGVEPQRIACVSFSAAMHSVIAVDAKGAPLSKCITWADIRAAPFSDRIRAYGGEAIYHRTGTPIHPMSPLAKLVWLRETAPQVFAAAARFIGIKEYVFQRFFGRYVVDHSIASATGLFDIRTLQWDREALAVAGIDETRLPELVPTTYVIEGLKSEIAQKTGLAPGTPFVVGANDGVLANLGVGAITPGSVAVTIGTSGAIRTPVTAPVTDPRGRLFCYVLAPGTWIVGGPVNNGGMILRWLRDEFGSDERETAKRLGVDPYDVLTQVAERAGVGAGGLLFHPYLAGERAPLWNADARGSFFGLAMHHRKEHMVRAVLEGVVFNLYLVLQLIEETGVRTERVLASGGFARSMLWRQIMADIFDREVVVGKSAEGSCLGAAVLGMYAIEAVPSLDVAVDMAGLTESSRPIRANTEKYRELTPIFARLPVLLHDAYSEIAAYQRRM
ncbi:MAG TPA: gluconokinase [Burkholderiaceae bacterium]|nr:gluconokinase [Burkholderiaceae bacterium]